MTAVAGAHRSWLPIQLESLGDPARGQHGESQSLLVRQAPRGRQLAESCLLPVDLLQERPAVVQAADLDPRRQAQAIHAKVRSVGVAADLPGVVLRPQKAGVLAG